MYSVHSRVIQCVSPSVPYMDCPAPTSQVLMLLVIQRDFQVPRLPLARGPLCLRREAFWTLIDSTDRPKGR